MSRPAPNDPNVLSARMPINNKVLIRRLFVLAHAGLKQRRVPEPREPEANILAHSFQRLVIDHPFAGGGIELRAARVVRHLESPPLMPRNAIHEMLPMISPDWHLPF